MKFTHAIVLFFAVTGFAVAATQRATGNGTQSFSVDGLRCPEVIGWSGGEPSANIIVESASPNASPKKHVGTIGYEPIVVETSFPLSPALQECIADLCANRATFKTLLLTTLDFNGKVQSTLQASNALLTEVQFPALDASSKQALHVTLIFRADPKPTTPESVSGAKALNPSAIASNFRVVIDGLPTTRVASVGAFTIKRLLSEDSAGSLRGKSTTTTSTVVPDFALSISQADQAGWNAWRDSFLLKGDNNDAAEKEGSLEILGADLKTTLFTLKLSHVGLIRLSLPPTDGESINRLRADLYCEAVSVVSDPKAAVKGVKQP